MTLTEGLQLLGLFSGLMFVGSLLFVPWLVNRLSPDYFIHHRQHVDRRKQLHPAQVYMLRLLRNGLGLVLLLAGIAMLILPGQGILTILIGISLMDFPGKILLLARFVRMKQIRKSLNWMRRKGGKEEFVFG